MKTKVVLASLLLISSSSFSQTTTDSTPQIGLSPRSWFIGGVGATQGQFGLGGGLFFTLGGEWALGLRGGFRTEAALLQQPSEHAWWVNPMLQYTPVYGSVGMVSVGVGAGLTGGAKRGQFLRNNLLVAEHEKVKYQVPSATAELQLALFATKSLGFIATGFTNLNKEQNQSGFLLGIQLRQP